MGRNHDDDLPQDPLVWIDCEMTGLDPDTDEILEIYCIITDGATLTPVNDNNNINDNSSSSKPDGGWGTVIHQPASRLDAMDSWCRRTHAASGLSAAVIASTTTHEQAAEELLAYVKKWVPSRRVGILAGNSVHADRAFLRKEPYKEVIDHLHYRILDVSSLREAAERWCPENLDAVPKKKGLHEARADILESIAEARYYRDAIFRPSVSWGRR